MRANQGTIDSTLAFRNEQGYSGSSPDPLRPKGRGDNPLLQPDFEQLVRFGLMLSPSFWADKDTIEHYSSGHSCLLGKLTITEFGDVLPCIFSRNHPVGNLFVASNLLAIVQGPNLRKIWRTTKDDVLVCKDCEYRYVCFDCRPLSEGVAQGWADFLNAPYPRCTYNPYTGEWARGLWRVREDGDPYYDVNFGPSIREVAQIFTRRVAKS